MGPEGRKSPAERPERILVAVDSSPDSERATAQAIALAKARGASVTGLHVYAARLHDARFRQMEGSLPRQYQRDGTLEHQRDVHDSLIARGLGLIADSYLDQTARACEEAGVPFERRTLEGKNYRVILEEAARGYDLLVIGRSGLGAVRPGVVGSVCARVVRRSPIDTLIVRADAPLLGDGPVVAGVDGSDLGYGALLSATSLAKELGAALHTVAVYDPHFHTVAFNRIREVLSEEAGRLFHLEQQEQIHDEVIDAGLGKIYQSHLAVSAALSGELGVEGEQVLLAGKPYDAMLGHLESRRASLLVVGATGVHADDGLDLGSNTEQLIALAPCNVVVTRRPHQPAQELIARETTRWTPEAEERLEGVPPMLRPIVRRAVVRYAVDRGHAVITARLVGDAARFMRPGGGGWASEAAMMIEEEKTES